jgi:site-specific DNA-methyltransferase (adenine-specific)
VSVVKVHTGDCFDVLPTLAAESVHACVTDPPYGLAFMGRDWDDFDPKEYQEFCEEWAREVKRVLKPGGHLLAFSGNRTHHRLFTGVEDAGFEIRDTITWHYGSGFPKASDISKTIDKRADAEREVVSETYIAPDGKERYGGRLDGDEYGSNDYGEYDGDATAQTAPATDAAKKWDGWKTGLKPATEFVVVARKPFDGATVDCVLEHGTGALNIDECRVGSDERTNPPTSHNDNCYADAGNRSEETVEGRYPANVIFDDRAAEQLDAKVGELDAGASPAGSHAAADDSVYGEFNEQENKVRRETDSGGPSRYFYTSKASRSERTKNGSIQNEHPTVKPVDLMDWLVTLVTAGGQTVLDPFTGSGTTGLACKQTGREFVGIEQNPEYADIARARIGLDVHDPSTLRDADAQAGLESF